VRANGGCLFFAPYGITFPVAHLRPIIDGDWPFGDPGLFSLFPLYCPSFGATPPAVRAFFLAEEGNEIASFGVQVLVDGLMTN
jgi:hypothetical protein